MHNSPIEKRQEVIEGEMVESKAQDRTVKEIQVRKEELNTYNRELRKLSNEIAKTNQLREQLMGQAIQEYWMDVNYYNSVVSLHNSYLSYALNRRVQFWTSYHKSDIYYRINPFSKKKKLQSEDELVGVLGVQVKVYNHLKDIGFIDNTFILVADFLDKVENEVFNPFLDGEWGFISNIRYRNTFQYSPYLKKRTMVQQLNLPPQPLQPTMLYNPNLQQKLIPNYSTVNDSIGNNLAPSQPNIIWNFIKTITQNEYQFAYLMQWIANFFRTLGSSQIILVLIGDDETTDIFINSIIKPIFAYREEYFCSITDEKLPDEKTVNNKILYHIDNLSDNKNIISKRVNQFVVRCLEVDDPAVSMENRSHKGQLIVTSSKDSPYPFLKDVYSRCIVLQVRHLKGVLENLQIDLISLKNGICADLDNFANSLAQYTFDQKYFCLQNTPEKEALPSMKNGILRTVDLEKKIDDFILAVRRRDIDYFRRIQDKNKKMFQELQYNFNENMIAQPLLSEYFHIVTGNKIFPNNITFLEILKEKAEMFLSTPQDASKKYNKKRYKIK